MNDKPIYCGKRTFLGLKDLVISYYTKKCQFQCAFCGIPSNSTNENVSVEDICKQIDYSLTKYSNEINEFSQMSVGNEGSILDRERFPKEAFDYLLDRAKNLTNLEVLSLETRIEYISLPVLDNILKKSPARKLDITIGFETQDDVLRNSVLNKKIDRKFFENKISLMGELGIRLTSYVMLKPGPNMTEEDGITEALNTINYLGELCDKNKMELVIYLNPTYIAKESKLFKTKQYDNYVTPKVQSVFKVIRETNKLGIPIYSGLWSEDLAIKDGDFTKASDFDIDLFNIIRQFNRNQNSHLLNV